MDGKELEKQYFKLKERRRQKNQYEIRASLILYFVAPVLLYALIFVSKTYETPLIVSIIIIGILLFLGKHWLQKSESILITNKEKLFFAFYNTA